MADMGSWMDGWQQVAIWSMIAGVLIVGLIIWGIVMVVRAASGRKAQTHPGSRTCKSCGMLVAPGNTNCPTCKAQMDWG